MEGQAKPTRRSKVTGLQDAARLARGALEERPELCLGGLFKQSRPVALVRALLAAGADGLHVYSSPGAGYDVDLMIAAGAVAQVFIPGVTLENRLCPNFRRAVEAGQVTAHALDALTVVGGLMASAHGVPSREGRWACTNSTMWARTPGSVFGRTP